MFSKYLKYFLAFLFIFLISITIYASEVYISNIYIRGNKKTKKSIILKELPFSTGSAMSEEALKNMIEEANQNLTNTSLFNYIDIFPEKDTIADNKEKQYDYYNIIISVEERWYYWPLVNIKLEERNLNSWIKKGEMDRITYDVGLKIYNMFGMNHKLSVSGSFGYETGFNLSYNNIRLSKSGRHLIGFSGYSLYNKTLNVLSKDNKPVYIKSKEGYINKNFGGAISYTYRNSIRNKHCITLEFDRSAIQDTVFKVNPNYWGVDGHRSHTFTLAYDFSIEGRNYNIYPTSGYYISAGASLGNVNGFELVYSKLNLNVQYYVPLSERWFWGSKINMSAILKSKNAYIYDKALGYDNVNMVGYDYYVADGQFYTILNNNLRYLIMPKKIVTLNFLSRLTKFYKIHFTIYGKLNVDAGYVVNRYKNIGNRLENRFLIGSGIGIDIVTYYDTVLSISYAVNKIGKKGFYFGISTPLI